MAHPDYWKVKAAILEAQIAQMRAQAQITAAQARQARALTTAGLDPDRDHEFIDADESIVVRHV